MEQPDAQDIRDTFAHLMLQQYGVDFVDDLLSADDDIAVHAAEEFSDIFFHQGDIYPHSATSVPHLVGALGLVGPGVRAELIHLLAGVATASNVSGGDASLIAEATRRVFERLSALEAYLRDKDDRVRLAALMSLTDLARINAPQMQFSRGRPPFVGAYPESFEPEAYRQHLRDLIGGMLDDFDSAWRVNCEAALAYLAFEAPDATGAEQPHPFWAMLERH